MCHEALLLFWLPLINTTVLLELFLKHEFVLKTTWSMEPSSRWMKLKPAEKPSNWKIHCLCSICCPCSSFVGLFCLGYSLKEHFLHCLPVRYCYPPEILLILAHSHAVSAFISCLLVSMVLNWNHPPYFWHLTLHYVCHRSIHRDSRKIFEVYETSILLHYAKLLVLVDK